MTWSYIFLKIAPPDAGLSPPQWTLEFMRPPEITLVFSTHLCMTPGFQRRLLEHYTSDNEVSNDPGKNQRGHPDISWNAQGRFLKGCCPGIDDWTWLGSSQLDHLNHHFSSNDIWLYYTNISVIINSIVLFCFKALKDGRKYKKKHHLKHLFSKPIKLLWI